MNKNDILDKIRLLEEKEQLEFKLKNIEDQLEVSRKECDHVRVCIGWDGAHQCRDTSFHTCLFCGENDPESRYKTIDATNYKDCLYDHGQLYHYRKNRLKALQELTKCFLDKDETLSCEDLVEKITKFIE